MLQISINGLNFKLPTSYNAYNSPVFGDTITTGSGKHIKDFICFKAAADVKYDWLPITLCNQLFSVATNSTVTASFPMPDGTIFTGECYLTLTAPKTLIEYKGSLVWTDISFTLEEV